MHKHQTMRQVFTAGLLALGLMSGLFAAGFLLPSFVWLIALYPGMLLAQVLFSVLPDTTISVLTGDADDGPAVYASMSVVFAFFIWWLCAFALLKFRDSWLRKRA